MKTMKKSVSVSQVYGQKAEWRGPEFIQNMLKPSIEIDVESSFQVNKKHKIVDVTIVSLTGRKYTVKCDAKKTTERSVLPTILAHEGIGGPERILFGLARLRKSDMVFVKSDEPFSEWLNDDEEEEGSKHRKKWRWKKTAVEKDDAVLTFYLRVKVYILPEVFGISKMVHHLYLQTRHDVMEGAILLDKPGDIFELASIAMQAEIGDCPDNENEVDYYLMSHYLPSEIPGSFEEDIYLKRKLSDYHKKWRGTPRHEAERKFLSMTSKNPQFGQQFFSSAWDSLFNISEVEIGVNQTGVYVWTVVPSPDSEAPTEDDLEFRGLCFASSIRRLRLKFPWSKIRKVSYDSKKVSIKTYLACEGELPQKFKFRPAYVQNKDFFTVAHSFHDFCVRLRKGLGQILLSREVWGVPTEGETNERSSLQENSQSKVLTQDNRVLPLYRCNSAELLDNKSSKPLTNGKPTIVKYKSETAPSKPRYVTRVAVNCSAGGGSPPERHEVTQFVAGCDSPASVSASTCSGGTSASGRSPPPPQASTPVGNESSCASSTADSGVGDGDVVEEGSSASPSQTFVRVKGLKISDSMIANCSRAPMDFGDSTIILETGHAVIPVTVKGKAGKSVEDKENQNPLLETPVGNEKESVASVSVFPGKERLANSLTIECTSGRSAHPLNVSCPKSNESNAWSWQDESVSQSLLERFATCGVGPERKIIRVRLERQEEDPRRWGLIVTEAEDKGFYVACMPYVGIAFQSGLVVEGDKLLQLNGKDLSSMTFSEVLCELNNNDEFLNLILSRDATSAVPPTPGASAVIRRFLSCDL